MIMNGKTIFVSLGAWCRPAHNLRLYARQSERFEFISGPFDWTITSFRALRICFSEGFEPGDVLPEENILVSFAHSGMCGRTGLVFHHALDPVSLGKTGSFSPGQKLPVGGAAHGLIDEARSRFIHTFGKLKSLRESGSRTVFVRWKRFGHPDESFAEVFEEETNEDLMACLRCFLGHDEFYLLTLTSEIIPDRREMISNPLLEMKVESDRSVSCKIRERKGWNGAQSNNFKGDEHSWRSALDAASQAWSL
jgi:hypothetical protein